MAQYDYKMAKRAFAQSRQTFAVNRGQELDNLIAKKAEMRLKAKAIAEAVKPADLVFKPL